MTPFDKDLWLFTPAEFERIPDGTVLISIMGRTCVKGVDYFDGDTRGGYLAYGVHNPDEHELKDLFVEFKMQQPHKP